MSAPDEAAPTKASAPVSTKRALGRNMAFNTAGLGVETAALTQSPQLTFPVNFQTTGTYRVWLRG